MIQVLVLSVMKIKIISVQKHLIAVSLFTTYYLFKDANTKASESHFLLSRFWRATIFTTLIVASMFC